MYFDKIFWSFKFAFNILIQNVKFSISIELNDYLISSLTTINWPIPLLKKNINYNYFSSCKMAKFTQILCTTFRWEWDQNG